MIDHLRKRITQNRQRVPGWRATRTPTTGRLRQPGAAAVRVLPVFALFAALLGLVLGAMLAFPLSGNSGITPNEPSPLDIRASRRIEYASDILTKEQQDAAAAAVPVVTQFNADLPDRERAEMQQLFAQVTATRNNDALDAAAQAAELIQLSPVVTPTLATAIVALSDDRWQRVADESVAVYDAVWDEQRNDMSEEDVAAVRATLFNKVDTALAPTERAMVQHFVDVSLTPNRTVDQAATEQGRAAARANVAPVMVVVRQGESIVRRGDVVSDLAYEKLQQYGLVFGAGGSTALLQQFVLGALVAWLLGSYLYFYHSYLATRRRSLVTIGAVAATVVLAARVLIPQWEAAPYGFPLAVAGVVLALLFDRQLALVVVLVLAPLVGLQIEDSIGLSITMALGGAAGVFATQRAARSATFVWVSLAVACATTVAASVFWFDRVSGTMWMQALSIPLLSLLNGLLASALAIGTYQLLARAAHVTTPLQLMELAHPNQPLLHRLMREAPGTYHHSVVVANLAEVAAEDIGADPLLARVGAYYHDIGKVIRPYFFTDNQYERSNVHDELDARTSAALIIDHVRDGIKLAHESQLPQQIIDFIAQHHGTMVVSYFYQRALHQDGDVDIDMFRYDGPKPQRRETGIMMLADGVEAAVRASAQSGKLRAARPDDNGRGERAGTTIGDVVDQIVNDRVRGGQLDECPLTLRDISIIKQSFVKTLQGIYHPRVEYPPAARQPAPEPTTGSV